MFEFNYFLLSNFCCNLKEIQQFIILLLRNNALSGPIVNLNYSETFTNTHKKYHQNWFIYLEEVQSLAYVQESYIFKDISFECTVFCMMTKNLNPSFSLFNGVFEI